MLWLLIKCKPYTCIVIGNKRHCTIWAVQAAQFFLNEDLATIHMHLAKKSEGKMSCQKISCQNLRERKTLQVKKSFQNQSKTIFASFSVFLKLFKRPLKMLNVHILEI